MALEGYDANTITALAELQVQLASDPKTREQYLGLVNQARPDIPIPELAIKRETAKETAQLREELAKMKEDQARRDAERRVIEQRELLVRQGLASESDIEAIEKTMVEEGIPNHKTAAELVRARRSVSSATPTPASLMPSRAFQGSTLKDFFTDPKGTAYSTASKALEEFRGNPRPVGL